jgi:MftR C-terminal domain
VITASPELQERERTKLTAVTAGLADALRGRGVAEVAAALLAQVGAAIFQAAFARWADAQGGTAFGDCLDEAAAEVGAAFSDSR